MTNNRRKELLKLLVNREMGELVMDLILKRADAEQVKDAGLTLCVRRIEVLEIVLTEKEALQLMYCFCELVKLTVDNFQEEYAPTSITE